MILARRAVVALVAVAGLALAVSGAWLALVLGPSGTARFVATQTGPLVIGPEVLGRIDAPVTVTASSGATQVFIGAGHPQDVADVVGTARVQQAVSARFPARSLRLRAVGRGALSDPRGLEVWRDTGVGTLELARKDAPESVLVVPTTDAPVRVTVEIHRGAWFLEALGALLVGLIIVGAAGVWLVHQLGARISLGHFARRDRPGTPAGAPSRPASGPADGFDEDETPEVKAPVVGEPEVDVDHEQATTTGPTATEVRP